MSRLALTLVCLGALTASAQTGLPTTGTALGVNFFPAGTPTTNSYSFGASSCHSTVLVGWTANFVGSMPCSAMKVWLTTGECSGDSAGPGDKPLADIDQLSVTSLKSGTFIVNIADLPAFNATADGGTSTACGADGVEITHRVCGSVSTAYSCYALGATQTQTHAKPLTLTYDTKPPPAPTVVDSSGYDGTARIGFTASSDTVTVGAQVLGPNDSDFVERATTTGNQTSILVKNLENQGADGGPVYLIRLVAYDAANNQSTPTDPVSVTIVHTDGFWGAYRSAGGTDPAGCSSTPAAVFTPLVLALGLWASRRRHP